MPFYISFFLSSFLFFLHLVYLLSHWILPSYLSLRPQAHAILTGMDTAIRLSRDSSIHINAVYGHHIGCSGFLQKLLDLNLVDDFTVDTRTPKPDLGAHNL